MALSFDDGRKDNAVVAAPLLTQWGIPATFNITTGYVDGTAQGEDCPHDGEAMTIEDVKALAHNPLFEVASHGDKHINALEDALESRRKLRTWLDLPHDAPMGFASPASLASPQLVSDLFASGFSYVRSGMRWSGPMAWRHFARRFSTYVYPTCRGYISAYKPTLAAPLEAGLLYSLPVTRRNRPSQVIAAVEWGLARRQPVIVMLHSILGATDAHLQDAWAWDVRDFTTLCQHLERLRDHNKALLTTTMQGLNRRLAGDGGNEYV